ncbi:uncharacterized protein LOC105699936 [Orussus abietinus]|uniref:uncharacterized protein LOC105699936 n=1 Tax=Orussus abietinus TaxID=222816 RepID=UPI000625897C|nr:uncharacterized protein LOC105699936 [Orussus abietinus]
MSSGERKMVELRTTSVLRRRLSAGRLHEAALAVLDAVFSASVAAPAVVGYWRGTWGLSDAYVYPENPVFSSAASIVVGFSGLFLFSLLQYLLAELLHPDKHRLFYYLGSRLYTALFGLCCVNAWRGAWQALDLYTELTPATVSATTLTSLLALALVRSLRNISAPPFALTLDSYRGYFEVPTMFRVDYTKDWRLYILDCAVSVGVVGTLVVFVWRGTWIMFDMYLYPTNREYSAIGSLVGGYALVSATFCLQPAMEYVCGRLEGLPRLITADAFLLVSFLGTVNVWRGIWNSLDLWLFPDRPELSCWITHVGCFVFLVLLNCSNSILVRGVYIDAEEEEGHCINFSCRYLRLFFKNEREKKEARRQRTLSLCTDGCANKDGENGALLDRASSKGSPGDPESAV